MNEVKSPFMQQSPDDGADLISKQDAVCDAKCTREEAIQELQNCKGLIQQDGQDYLDERDFPLLDMAIEALHTDVMRCKDCKHQEHCYETVAHTRLHDGFKEHWSEPIEWCSRGERKGGDDE